MRRQTMVFIVFGKLGAALPGKKRFASLILVSIIMSACPKTVESIVVNVTVTMGRYEQSRSESLSPLSFRDGPGSIINRVKAGLVSGWTGALGEQDLSKRNK